MMLLNNKLRVLCSGILMGATVLGCSSSGPIERNTNTPIATASNTVSDIYADYLTRDVRDEIFYFVMPDRFHNADPSNDNGSTTLAISRGGLDLSSSRAFHGGDMAGVEAKLDYLKNMGITSIWMTPILRNKADQYGGYAHHGYWIVDFTQIDSHFGTNGDLKSLIDSAHKKGIKVFFDIITNHTADVIKYRECHDDKGDLREGLRSCEYKSLADLEKGERYTPFVPDGEKTVKAPAWLNDPKYYHNQGDTTFQGENSLYGDFNGLDDINTELPEVVTGMIDIYQNIIREFKPDGFRIDTVRHVQLPFWQSFGPAIMDYAKAQGIPNFHIFGEVYDPNPARLSEFTTEGKLPAVLDFGFQDAAADTFFNDNGSAKIEQLFVNDDYYNDADSQADLLLTFLGNHDMGRPGYFITEGMEGISAAEKLQRSILAHAFMYFSRGIPVVYYGDEQGFTGDGGDIGAREDMFPSKVPSYNDNELLGTDKTTADDNFDQQHPIYLALKDLSKLRLEHKALRSGVLFNRYFQHNDKLFAFSRVDLDEQQEYLVVFNSDTKARSVQLDSTGTTYRSLTGGRDLSASDNKVHVHLEPLSYAVYKSDRTLSASKDLSVRLSSMEPATDADDRMHLRYQLDGVSAQVLPLYEVTTEYRVGDADYVVAAKDFTPPYSAYIPKHIVDNEATQVRVRVSNLQGKVRISDIQLPE